MKTTTINEKEYFYKMTISACKKFKEKFKVNVAEADPADVEQLQYILFLGLEAGTKIEKGEFDLKADFFDNYDLKELNKVVDEITPESAKK